MAQQPAPPKTNAAGNPLIVVVLLVSAAMLAALGTILPGMMGFTGTERWVMSGVFYLAAAGDVAIALWFRAKLKKQRAAASSGGTIQRQ